MLLSVLPWIFSPFPSALAAQPSAPAPISASLRELEFGQLNFLHTTDTHGWLAGHLQEPSYSADWGDYVSFATRMREKVEAQGQDLLVVDTGDRVEGNGLYDSSAPKGVYLSEILRHQHIDVITSGNHELYKQNTSEAEFLTTVPNFRGKYLASNIDITHPETNELVPLAPRFKKFTTKQQGIRIVAFGFLFDFTGNYNNTVVQPVEKTIKEDWFQEAIRDKDVDLFLVAGHVPAHSPEYRAIFEEIRGIRWDTPIQFFGGHQHIRDYAKYDSKAFALASGRFMETIGFMSIDGLSTSDRPSTTSGPVFKRRYIDNNLYSFYHHTGLDEESFPTEKGRNVSQLITESRSALRLDRVHGCAPRTLWMSRVPYPHKDSVFTWLQTQVLPDSLKDESRGEVPSVAILNTGAIRFDIFQGQFTQDTIWTISPFTNSFRYVKDVPYEKVQLIMEVLNKQTKILDTFESGSSLPPLPRPENLARMEDFIVEEEEESLDTPIYDMAALHQAPISTNRQDNKIVPGYTTKDDAGTDGDDTLHSPISFYQVPNCIQALLSANTSGVPETVDLIYIEFIQPHLALAAKFAGLDVDFFQDSDVYMSSTTMTDLLLAWVKKHWKCE
ncbi:uncharacterized protein N7498_007551 [Penicillium cinerascens]|uniref:Calcineurin-like phosphoesterase domain-containing protein n=1 Tax=Penicillium cinerascens TaxID=70096 RepID=A0A9W9JK64_9EURO|nr:uncharacterized protein N7498_007551 [Penicillium cinerascens]KAJ5198434.1 hypothetical protein N7498_007551 [Penicillium cinerascens]